MTSVRKKKPGIYANSISQQSLIIGGRKLQCRLGKYTRIKKRISFRWRSIIMASLVEFVLDLEAGVGTRYAENVSDGEILRHLT
jgi:hypothetical protein